MCALPGAVGTAEAAGGAATRAPREGETGCSPQEGQARGERRGVFGGEAEAAGVPPEQEAARGGRPGQWGVAFSGAALPVLIGLYTHPAEPAVAHPGAGTPVQKLVRGRKRLSRV